MMLLRDIIGQRLKYNFEKKVFLRILLEEGSWKLLSAQLFVCQRSMSDEVTQQVNNIQ